MPDDGWGSFLVVVIIWAACMYMQWSDHRHDIHRW